MSTDYDYITPIKDELTKNLKAFCEDYIEKNKPNPYSPRWFNFREHDIDTQQLTIQSTQLNIGFTIDTPFDYIEVNVFWRQFKEFRTEYILNNFEQINTY